MTGSPSIATAGAGSVVVVMAASAEVGVEAAGEGQHEGVERGVPTEGGLALDEAAFGFAFALRPRPRSFSRSAARLSSMFMVPSQSSLTAASSVGTWPRVLVILRSW